MDIISCISSLAATTATAANSSSFFSATTISVVGSIFLCFVIYFFVKPNGKNWRNAPPGPIGWPILGSLPYLSDRLHEDLFHLAKKYGPLMSIKMGLKPAIVISSPEMAYEALKVNDASIAERNITEIVRIVTYDASSVVFAVYGPHWKALRRLLLTELLSPKSFQTFVPLRSQQVRLFLKEVYTASGLQESINISVSAFVALLNHISNVIVSESLFDDNTKRDGRKLKMTYWEIIKTVAIPNIADLIPILKPFDPQGLKKKITEHFKTLDAFYNELIAARFEEMKKWNDRTEKQDLLNALLEFVNESTTEEMRSYRLQAVKGMLSEMFVAATETTSSTIEWAMAEILGNPRVHKKLLSELDQVIGKHRLMEESDITNLPYLQACIKENYRLHPGVPLLITRRASDACKIKGYSVPKHCIVYVNVWGMGRDPKVWKNPLEFMPERFVGSNIDWKGQHFNFLPFGTGRRSCIGGILADRMAHYCVAALLHGFEWDIPAEDAKDRSERVGLAIQKGKTLVGVPKPRLGDHVYQSLF